MEQTPYRGLSLSPQHGSFPAGFNPGPSELENLTAGRERKLSDLVDQAVYERLVGGHIDVPAASSIQNSVGNAGLSSQNSFSALLVRYRGF